MDFTHFYRKPPKDLADQFNAGFTLEKSGYLRQYPYSSKFNLVLNDSMSRDAVFNDVACYKKFGGGKFYFLCADYLGTFNFHCCCQINIT